MPASAATQRYLNAVLAADRWQVQAATDAALADGLSPLAIYEAVYAPALHEVGLRWERAELSVTAEHIATALTEAEMTRLLPRFLAGVRLGRSAVVASVEGEQHRVGARMVADCFESLGWDGVFVGGDVPLDDFLAEVARLRPDAVALSLTMAMNADTLIRTVDAVRARWPRLPLLVGGQGLAHLDRVALCRERESVRYVASLGALRAVIQGLERHLAPEPAPTHEPDPLPVPPHLLAALIGEVQALPLVPLAVVDTFEALTDRLVADVDTYLLAQPDVRTLVGQAGLARMRQNHKHHALFIASWLRQRHPEGLVRTLVWVLQAYRNHGFHLTYWGRELEGWQATLAANLPPEQARLLRPLYTWMQGAIPRLAAALHG